MCCLQMFSKNKDVHNKIQASADLKMLSQIGYVHFAGAKYSL